jgi:hypothetical protein
MALEETTRHPLVNGETDHLNESRHTYFKIFRVLSLLNSIEEELLEGLKRVEVHEVNNPELDEQEVEHGTLSGDRTIRLSRFVNLLFCDLGEFLFLLDLN